MSLPRLISRSEIHDRLQIIFPDGTPHRDTSTWEIAASTIFVMLYIGAIEGRDHWLRPDQVTKMTDAQSNDSDDASRERWARDSIRPGKADVPGRWYAGNTRESVRDDTLRVALIPNGAVIERPGISTTSPLPRYALRASFAELFLPDLTDADFLDAAEDWRTENLSPGSLARIAIVRTGGIAGGDHVLVTFPSGETRRMAPGQSSVISKAVIEEFSHRFLQTPALISLSESKDKVIARDDAMAKRIGLNIQADRTLPDIVLADVGPQHPLLIFVEVVASDGPITPERQAEFLKVAADAGFDPKYTLFVTAFMDRSAAAFKKSVASLAWNAFVWFAAEPNNLMVLKEGHPEVIRRLATWI